MRESLARSAAAALAAVFLLAAAPAGLYDVPSPLPSAAPGTVIWSRPFTGGAQLRTAASNTLVLYHTVSAGGKDVAVSGTISIPKGTPPAGGWPVISWAHGTTGNAPQCAPSNFARPNGEQRFLERWVSDGFAVLQTDYEGEGTPGLHPYFAGVSGAHDVIDIVRAARHLNPNLSDRWFAMGHSEGGSVAVFVAATAASWAPELHFLGAVAYAPASDIPDFFGRMTLSREPTTELPLLGMMIEGIASTDPQVDLKDVLTPKGLALLPLLQSDCVDRVMASSDWIKVAPADIFLPGARSSRLLQDFFANEPSLQRVQAPLLIEQGTNDAMVPYQGSASLRMSLCGNGAHPELDAVQGGTHDSAMELSYAHTNAWVADRLAGKPATGNCPE